MRYSRAISLAPCGSGPAGRAAQHCQLAVYLDQIVEIPKPASELPRPAWSEHEAASREIVCQRSPILRDTVRYLTEFPRVHRHSINAVVDIVGPHLGRGTPHGSGDGNTVSYLKRVGRVWDISS